MAAIGGFVYVLFAQFLVALDDWLAHGVVSVTGSDFGNQMAGLTDKFRRMGDAGSFAANALMLVLMVFALVAGVVLWIVLLLRKMAILVVVAFAPLLIAGWLWGPTRSWSRKATEVLVALVFSKTVIYMIFGIGMSLLLRSNQSLSDFVGVVVLLCGACFAPLVMLRLVHFAADSHLAGEMIGTLRSGAQPAMNRLNARPGIRTRVPQRRQDGDRLRVSREGRHGDGLRRWSSSGRHRRAPPPVRRPLRPQPAVPVAAAVVTATQSGGTASGSSGAPDAGCARGLGR